MSENMSAAQERLNDYTRRVAEIQRQAEETQEQIKSMRARSASPDGSVTVVLAPGGRLESLDLGPRALDLGRERLAAEITRTIQSAHAAAAEQLQHALRPLVGESDAMEFLRSQVDDAMTDDPADTRENTPEDGGRGPADPAQPRRPRDNDDDEPFGGSIMR